MQYRRLGSTNMKVSAIGVGTWQFGGEWDKVYQQAEIDAILDRAAEHDINFIDTAECYGDHLSERLVGDYLSRRNRGRWLVATKFGHHYHGFMNRTFHLEPRDVEAQLEASLRALRVESIDLYQFHSGSDQQFLTPGLWTMLLKQKELGKIRHLGISIASKGDSFQAREARKVGAEVLQVVYNRLERRAERDFFPHAESDDLGVFARVPLASGFLTGKYTTADPFPKTDVRSTFDQERFRQWLAELELIRTHELPSGAPMAQWALAWCLKNPRVSCAIPGCKDLAQLEVNASAAKLLGP